MNKDSYLYVFGGLVILVLLGIFAVLLVQTLQPAAAVEPTPTLYEFPTLEAVVGGITATASPSNTAEPTATDTQEPSRTPVPTVTVDTAGTQQAQIIAVYLATFDDINQTARLTKQRFENTFGQLIEGKVNEHDDTWKGEVTALLAEFNSHLAQMRGITPPAGYELAHDTVVYGMERCSIGWTAMYNATQAGDHNAYNNAIGYVHECNESWNQGEEKIANLRR